MRTEMSLESDTGDRVLVGKCGCGAVRYRVADAFLYASKLPLLALSRGYWF